MVQAAFYLSLKSNELLFRRDEAPLWRWLGDAGRQGAARCSCNLREATQESVCQPQSEREAACACFMDHNPVGNRW